MATRLDRYKDFRVRELWMKDPRQCNPRLPLLIDEKMFLNACNHPDTYYSIRRYPLEARMCEPENLHEFDSVAGMFFDIDGHIHGVTIRHLIEAATRLSRFLVKELDLHEDELMVWWSGRGFHLAVPPEVIMATPACGAEQNYKLFADWARRSIKLHEEIQVWNNSENKSETKTVNLLDGSIYHRRALIRVPGTKNSNSRFKQNLPKVYMPLDRLYILANEKNTQEQINKLSLIVRDNLWSDSKRWV